MRAGPKEPALVRAEGLTKTFKVRRGGLLRKGLSFNAVDGVDLALHPSETLGIVGESGCGKSTLAKLLIGLMAPTSGTVHIDGEDTARISDDAWRALRRRVQMVYQDSAGSLDGRMTVGSQVEEPLRIHGLPTGPAHDAMDAAGLKGTLQERYPHEMSGGQLQRVVIARALALSPDMMVLDEPVSALDVSIQAQIVNLLIDLQAQHSLAYVFVSHDLGVVRHIADRVAVMYLGRIVEEAPKAALYAGPLHPYAHALLQAVPKPDPARRRRNAPRIGDPPNPLAPPPGCRFHPRCPHAIQRCRAETPMLRDFGGRRAACHRIEEIA